MGRKITWIKGYLFVATVVLCACSPKGEVVAQESTQGELPLPDVPKELMTPAERAAFVLTHFWDDMDFCDTLRSHDSQFMELNFVNFISVFPHASDNAVETAVHLLLERASQDSLALTIVTNFAEKYFSEADSPMRDEEYYIIFLEELLRLPTLSATERLRPNMQLLTAKKNRRGTRATDFTYTTREGKRTTLHQTESDMTLLIFYDPACSHCTDILKSLRASTLIQQRIDEGSLSVLAVYTEGNRELWDETKTDMPQDWTVAIDESHIVDGALYNVPAMPVIYLLSHDKTVLLKDTTQQMLEQYLSEL